MSRSDMHSNSVPGGLAEFQGESAQVAEVNVTNIDSPIEGESRATDASLASQPDQSGRVASTDHSPALGSRDSDAQPGELLPRPKPPSRTSSRQNVAVADAAEASNWKDSNSEAGPSTTKGVPISTSQTHNGRPERPERASRRDQQCDACGKPMTGQFVRALGVVFHLDCFRCRDCDKVVAAKFFPATEEMSSSSPAGSSGSHEGKQSSPTAATSGKLFPLCETDYFRRLDLICANCGGALRGSYITALGKKFHVEHFTCSICPTVFGPQDSYYEHDGKVFCHFHYSTRFAIRCTGCRTAILKQFVEINRNNTDEHWHPECYMIHKFWNIKLSPTGSTPRAESIQEPVTSLAEIPEPSNSGVAPTTNASANDAPTTEALETEASETPSSLKAKQKRMEEEVYRIWTVLSAFEESSAACISDMLRHVSAGRYLGGVQMAERFILHVEVLFSAIDSIETFFKQEQTRGISHVREARMLCKKVVNFFSLLSHTQEIGAQRMGITQELLSLVTGLAHYLKILIRIALTGALRLERDFDNHQALSLFLDNLASLAQEEGSPRAKAVAGNARTTHNKDGENSSDTTTATSQQPRGYESLPRSMSSTVSDTGETATDLCVRCGQTVEEECVRVGTNLRWHTSCVKCLTCNRPAIKDTSSRSKTAEPEDPSLPPPIAAEQFWLDIQRGSKDGSANSSYKCFCSTCKTSSAQLSYIRVTRLEQYAYLLRVALIRLYALLRRRGAVPATPPPTAPVSLTASEDGEDRSSLHEEDSPDTRRKKSVNLEQRLSTKAKVPHISTVVGGPSGHASSVQKPISPSDQRLRRSPSPSKPTSLERSAEEVKHKPVRQGSDLYRQHSPQQSSSDQAHNQQILGTRQGPIVPIRPAFARHNTDVRIQDQGPVRQPSGDDANRVINEPEEGLKLSDIPQMLQAEQDREHSIHTPVYRGRYISELSPVELFIVKHTAALLLQQTPLKDAMPFDELVEFLEARKSTFWGKLFKGGKDKKKVEKKGVFSVPLEMLVDRSGADSSLGYKGTVLRIPSFIDDIISAMKQMDVTIEGIFRKNGNIRRLKELTEAIDRDSSSVNLSDDNPVQLAALLKKWLRELPDPLMTFKLHRMWIIAQGIEPESERLRCLHLVSMLLPKAHRDTMEVLFVFFRWVASFSHIDEETGSKMDVQNLSVVLAPNVLYSKGSDPLKDELFLANRVLQTVLENQEALWRVPAECVAPLQDRELLNPPADLTSREMLRKCEKYVRRGSGKPGATLAPNNGHAPVPNGRSQAATYGSSPAGNTAIPRQFSQDSYFDGSMSPVRSSGYPRSPGEQQSWGNNRSQPIAQQQQQPNWASPS